MAALAPSLKRMFAEFDAHWPHRGRGTDGWYHAPQPGYPIGHTPGHNGFSHAIDVTARGIDEMWVINHIYRNTHVLWYIIWNRGIWSNTWGFSRHNYTGSNPHTDHMHIEIRQTTEAEYYSGPWGIRGGDSSGIGAAPPGPGEGSGIGTAPGFDPGTMPIGSGIGVADERDHRDALENVANWAHTTAGVIIGAANSIKATRNL